MTRKTTITPAQFQQMQAQVLKNFHGPDRLHSSWWLNPEEVVLAVLGVAGIEVEQAAPPRYVEDRAAVMRASLASRGYVEVNQLEGLRQGEEIINRTTHLSAKLLHIFTHGPDAALIVHREDDVVTEWLPFAVERHDG